MATISLSPSPAPLVAMSSRRAPLTSNPNVANSPLRAPSTLNGYPKQKRSYATVQREEAYGQPPPVKKQALENGSRAVRSPSKTAATATASRTHVLVQRGGAARSTTSRDRVSRAAPAAQSTRTGQEADTQVWRSHYKAKFPKMVFYFESIPDDVRAKLVKRVTYFGAVCAPALICLFSRPSTDPHSAPRTLLLDRCDARNHNKANPLRAIPASW